MLINFNGIGEYVIGKKLPSDSTMNNMRKKELIELLHIAQHNYEVLVELYNNAVNLNAEKFKKLTKEI